MIPTILRVMLTELGVEPSMVAAVVAAVDLVLRIVSFLSGIVG